MKIQIDSTAKTIKVQENTNFKKLYEMLKALPKEIFGKWEEYSIEANAIVYSYYPYYPLNYWYTNHWQGIYGSQSTGTLSSVPNNNSYTVTTSTNSGSSESNTSTFNIELS